MRNESTLHSFIFLILFIIIAKEIMSTIRIVPDELFNRFSKVKYLYILTAISINTKTFQACILYFDFFGDFGWVVELSFFFRSDEFTSVVFGSSCGVFIDIIQIKDKLTGSTNLGASVNAMKIYEDIGLYLPIVCFLTRV
ncbi:hypothetical protein J1C08_004133 [Escherichia fergusonii]|nr:hypothetical protein [Escherichia fergusonii]